MEQRFDAVEGRVDTLQGQTEQALQEAQHAKRSTAALQGAVQQGLLHAVQQLDTAPTVAPGRAVPPASAARRRPAPTPAPAAAKRARVATTRPIAAPAHRPPPAVQPAPAAVPVPVLVSTESGEVPPGGAADAAYGTATPAGQALPPSAVPAASVDTSAGSLALADGAAQAGDVDTDVHAVPVCGPSVPRVAPELQALLGGLDTALSLHTGQAMATALREQRVTTVQCVRGTWAMCCTRGVVTRSF